MTNIDIPEILRKLDIDRIGDADPSSAGGVVRYVTLDGGDCTIIYSRFTESKIDDAILREKALADEGRYNLEWKVYGHDGPANLKGRLVAAGFEPETVEKFMVLPVTAEALDRFPMAGHDVRRVDTVEGLVDLVASAASSGQCDPDEEMRRLAPVLEQEPESMSVFVAYVDGVPVAGGRIQYNERRDFAGLYGGRTSALYRNQGHYVALVGARLHEAYDRGIAYLFIDALPTSEPIVAKRGFTAVTDTQPFVWRGGKGNVDIQD